MKFTQEKFGEYQNQTVNIYTLENQNGTRLSVLNYAGIWHQFSILKPDNQRVNLLLSANNLDGYTNNPYFINRIIGRVAGRIKDAKWTQNDQMIQTIPNEGNNSLHGGANGLHNQFYQVEVDENLGTITLSTKIDETIDSFPGSLDFKTVYTLFEDDKVQIDFTGTQSQKDGVFNPTIHGYFNIGNSQETDILNQSLQLASKRHLAVDDGKVPTGNFVENQNTAFDFSQTRKISQAIDQLKNQSETQAFDDIFEVDGSDNQPIATLTDPDNQNALEVYSNRNGLVVFTPDNLPSEAALNRGNGHPYQAIALEPHVLSNSQNIPEFGEVWLKDGETRTESISFNYRDI